jgi:aromatic-L-amino-acid/L-tryptophan decarboxylase
MIFYLNKHKRMQDSNEINEKLLKKITEEGLIYMVPGQIDGIYYLRFAICAASTQKKHIEFAYDVISRHAQSVIENK